MDHQGERFLQSKDSSLQNSLAVELEQIRRERAGEEVETKPAEKISDWMEVLEKTHMGHNDDPKVLDRIKDSYHKRFVIKPDAIPEAAFQLEARIARNRGHGDIPITEGYREAKSSEIIANQEQSLDRWVDYLTSPNAMFPTWAKYWAFTDVTAMGKFEKKIDEHGKETARFANRTDDTVASFPPLNPRALAMSIGAIEAKVAQKDLPKSDRRLDNTSTRLNDPEFSQLLSGGSFSKLYTQFLIELPAYSTEGLRETHGRWVKYEQGADAAPLVDSLGGHPLEWCTADYETAQTQLQGGDFHVYYSLDETAEANIPRVAIRMDRDQIAEVRGIAPDQNLDPFIADVVQDKMSEFPDGEKYKQRTEDMKRVTELEELRRSGREFSTDDLRFLYEINRNIEGFGVFWSDPRIEELIDGRDSRTDMATILEDETPRGGTVAHIFHSGSLPLGRLETAEDLILPAAISGDLDLGGLSSAKGLKLPEIVGGDLNLCYLETAEGLVLPVEIGGFLDLRELRNAKGLKFPEPMGGGISLESLETAEGLVLPTAIGGDLDLDCLESSEGLKLPETMSGHLVLNSLRSAEGLKLPETIGGISLDGLHSAEGLTLPETMGGSISLCGLNTAEGLILPTHVGGWLELDGLWSAEGLKLPETIGGELSLKSLETASGLILPDDVQIVQLRSLPDEDVDRLRSLYPTKKFITSE